MANFRRLSRYTGGTLAENREGNQFLVLRRPLQLEPAEGDVFITISKELERRPDLIAVKAYGNADLWWAIYEFNEIRDPYSQLKQGQILRIPELQRVIAAIEQLEDR
jgi:nucleoid-associated protein YgaU